MCVMEKLSICVHIYICTYLKNTSEKGKKIFCILNKARFKLFWERQMSFTCHFSTSVGHKLYSSDTGFLNFPLTGKNNEKYKNWMY